MITKELNAVLSKIQTFEIFQLWNILANVEIEQSESTFIENLILL